MLKIIKKYILVIAGSLALTVPVLATAGVSAYNSPSPGAGGTAGCTNNIQTGIDSGITATGDASGANCGGNSVQTGISSIAKTVINIFSLVVGIVSVFMIIY